MKFCPMCKLDLEENNFTKNITRYDGYDSYCKSCRKHKYNKEKQNEYSINENKHNNLIWKKYQILINMKHQVVGRLEILYFWRFTPLKI